MAGEVCTDGSAACPASRRRRTIRSWPGCVRPARSSSASRACPSSASTAPPTARARSAATRGTRPARRRAVPAAARPRSPPARCRSRTATTAWARCGCPAAACGLVTLKPGRGVVPGRASGADSWSGMAENGALATTVADLAVAHAVLAGEEPAPLAAPGRPLRIAVSTRSPVPGVRADAATRAAVDARRRRADRRRAHRRAPGPADHPRRRRRGRWPAGWPAPRTTPSTSGSTARRSSRAAAPTPGSGGWSAGRAGPAARRPSGSASGWSTSSTTSTCCSAR